MSKTDKCLCDLCTYMCTEGFVRGEASDIIINVMGRSFPLHKIILMRSPYFRAMFSGKWKETTTQSPVQIDIENVNVTLESVTLALKSLYVHRIGDLNESNQFAVLFTAEFFQLDGLIKQTYDHIISHLNCRNIVQACMFAEGREELMNGCTNWLSLHMHHISQIDHYWEIPIKIFQTLIEGNQLWVKTEYLRYKLAHTYLTHRQFQTHDKEPDQLLISNFLVPVSNNNNNKEDKTSKRKTADKPEGTSPQTTPKKLKNPKNDNEPTSPSKQRDTAFLESKEGQPYVDMFRSVHYCHMRPEELASVKQDGILPQEWIQEVYQYYYHLFTNTLGMEHKSDKYSCRYGFEFKDVVPPQYETTDELTSTDFSFAGSRWKLLVGFGHKDELDEDRELWLYCELFRLFSDADDSDSTFKTYTNPNKKHSVSYQIIMLPSSAAVTHVYAHAEECTLKEGFKDGKEGFFSTTYLWQVVTGFAEQAN